MGFDYSLKIYIKKEIVETVKFIDVITSIARGDNLFINKSTYDKAGRKLDISTVNDMYSLCISEIDENSQRFISAEYGTKVNTRLTFRPHGRTGIDGVNSMFQLVFMLLSCFEGDCILVPNGDYIAFLRRKGCLYIDTSKGCFNGVDFSQFDISYIDTNFEAQ